MNSGQVSGPFTPPTGGGAVQKLHQAMTEWEQAADASPEFETEFHREVPLCLVVEYCSGNAL